MRKRTKIYNFAFLLVLTSVLFACGDKAFYSEVKTFKNHVWNAKDKQTFEFDVSDTSKLYDITIFLRVDSDYDYNNLWIYLFSTLPNHKEFREAHQFYVSNDKGEWIGKKSGSMVECEMNFVNRKFPQPGKYKFVIEQATTNPVLNHVADLGMKVTEVKKTSTKDSAKK